jgi:hypothetical protein
MNLFLKSLLTKQFVRFLGASIFKTFVSSVLYYSSLYFFLDMYISYTLSFIFTYIITLFVYNYYVFNTNKIKFKVTYIFLGYSVAYLVAAQSIIYLLSDINFIKYYIPILMPILLFLPNYICTKFIFKNI